MVDLPPIMASGMIDGKGKHGWKKTEAGFFSNKDIREGNEVIIKCLSRATTKEEDSREIVSGYSCKELAETIYVSHERLNHSSVYCNQLPKKPGN